MADFSLPNYPAPFGTRSINITNHKGPGNYQAGGETVNASTFGWGSFDKVHGGLSTNANNTGNYTVVATVPVGQAQNNATGSNTVKLKWQAANGTEASNATDLSGEYVRIEYIGG